MNNILDLKDKKILYALDLNARKSFKEIGREVKLSKEVVNYRIKRMEALGIIKGYYTVINMTKLGYICNVFYVKLRDISIEKEKEMINYFISDSKYWWVDSADGYIDLGVGVWEKSIADAYKTRTELFTSFKQYFGKVMNVFYVNFYIYNKAYLLGKKTKETKPIIYKLEECIESDDTDKKILDIISDKARIPTVEIAKNINLPISTVNFRLKKLIENKVIEGFRPILDLSKIGYYWYKVSFVLKDYTKKQQILDFCSIHPNIVYAYETTGDYDLDIEMEVESYERFRSIIEEIKTKFKDTIESYDHLLWYKEHKLSFPISQRETKHK